MTSPRARRAARWILVVYLLALHGFALVLVVKTDFLTRAGKTLGWIPPEEWTESWYRAVLAQAARDRAVPAGGVVLLGDSIIAGLDPALVAPDAANFGLGGDTTRTLRARLPTLRAPERARAIIVGVGVNDLKYRDPPAIAADFATVLADLPPRVIVLAPLPVDESAPDMRARRYLRNDRIRALGGALRRLCDASPGCAFVDAAAALPVPQTRGPDGWHLSPDGEAVLAGLLRQELGAGAAAP